MAHTVQPLTPAEIAELQQRAAGLPVDDLLPRLLATIEIERGVAKVNAAGWRDEMREKARER